MARSLDQILTELHAVYQPQKDQYSSALRQVDPAQQAEEQGLQAAKTDAFSQIETAANRRGVFYGGMPIAEEQRYTGLNFYHQSPTYDQIRPAKI
jgi:bifunctional N-acetylglucosamine-1-phosphate-uridyltransferase/glucosamine-1-phosphate-acetyltransferase GlmU-like protein